MNAGWWTEVENEPIEGLLSKFSFLRMFGIGKIPFFLKWWPKLKLFTVLGLSFVTLSVLLSLVWMVKWLKCAFLWAQKCFFYQFELALDDVNRNFLKKVISLFKKCGPKWPLFIVLGHHFAEKSFFGGRFFLKFALCDPCSQYSAAFTAKKITRGHNPSGCKKILGYLST